MKHPTQPAARVGEYVEVNGRLYPIIGPRTNDIAAQALRDADIEAAPIFYWTGARWSATELSLLAVELDDTQEFAL